MQGCYGYKKNVFTDQSSAIQLHYSYIGSFQALYKMLKYEFQSEKKSKDKKRRPLGKRSRLLTFKNIT
jgi:hypothetical protein